MKFQRARAFKEIPLATKAFPRCENNYPSINSLVRYWKRASEAKADTRIKKLFSDEERERERERE
jgi:hypothetical protein